MRLPCTNEVILQKVQQLINSSSLGLKMYVSGPLKLHIGPFLILNLELLGKKRYRPLTASHFYLILEAFGLEFK